MIPVNRPKCFSGIRTALKLRMPGAVPLFLKDFLKVAVRFKVDDYSHFFLLFL